MLRERTRLIIVVNLARGLALLAASFATAYTRCVASLTRRLRVPAARGLLVSACVCLLTLGIAEVGARALLGALRAPDSYEAERNPHFRRGWTEYTEPRLRDPRERLIVLIGNSQGFANEYEDASVCFPSRLQRALARTRPEERWTVLNWSVSGGQGPEFAVLGARAVSHRPDLVLFVTHAMNFTGAVGVRGKTRPVTYGISDVGELAYLGSVRKHLSPEFLSHFQVCDPTTWLMAHSGLVQLRNRLVEPRAGAWTWESGEQTIEGEPVHWGAGRWTADAGWLLRECVRATTRKERSRTPVLIVSMPLRRPSFRPADWFERSSFANRARAALAGEPSATVVDAVSLVDPSLFCTHTHLKPGGHVVFGDWLATRVLESIGR